ncbi:Calcium-binding EF-hand family protein [Arabidopsis thaliana]|uniref:Calcium-binding EF-hand family protein n=1 Tax=Arabidopsis thaliana TaxID=3702 RepID=A0A1I9LRS6_ARATH|nr:Calcium-binding EF-hand family protein [Arabidopsis thaliana]ANM65284.1 Calcium-binding EF-hand family protein [Arabidopsis thaliana]|eukprot:NP_001327262.1 Calcium-binding EF-hand family protein [Arabidopsis thaliana]
MSGYPPSSQGYGYGGNPPPPQPPYGSTGNNPPPYGSSGSNPPPPYGSSASSPYAVPYGAQPAPYGAPPSAPYASLPGDHNKPHKEKPHGASYGSPSPGGYGAHPSSGPSDYGGYGGAPQQSGHGGGYGGAPQQSGHGGGYGAPPPQASYGSPFASLVPSAFPPGTDPNIVACFQAADRDNSGFIDDKELQGALSSYNQSFSIRTVHLLMYLFTNSNVRKIGPKEFTSLFFSLQNWRSIFERFDKDRSGRIDTNELRDALMSLGFSVSPVILDLLVSKFDKSGGRNRAIEYDNFIECCLTVKVCYFHGLGRHILMQFYHLNYSRLFLYNVSNVCYVLIKNNRRGSPRSSRRRIRRYQAQLFSITRTSCSLFYHSSSLE